MLAVFNIRSVLLVALERVYSCYLIFNRLHLYMVLAHI